MPATLKLDRLENAQFTNDLINGRQVVRAGFISDIPIGSLRPDPNVLITALSTRGMPQLSDPHPAGLGMYVVRHIFYPVSDTQAKVEIIYESSPITPDGAVFIITDHTTLTADTTQFLPGTFKQLNIKYKSPRGGATLTDTGTISYPQAMRQKTLEKTITAGQGGLQIGTNGVPDIYPDTVGAVNKNPWLGKPAGFWLMTGFDSQTSTWGRSYLVSATFTTKIRYDFSQYVALRQSDGRMLPVDPAEIERLTKTPYANDIISGNGIVKVGAHPMVDFRQVFGIS